MAAAPSWCLTTPRCFASSPRVRRSCPQDESPEEVNAGLRTFAKELGV
jgi:hypothetical protein